MAKGNLYFYRLTAEKKLFSFGDAMKDVPILGSPLATCQEQAVSPYGTIMNISSLNEIKQEEYFVFDEDLCFTPDFISEIVKLSAKKKSFRVCLAENNFNQRFVLPHSTNEQDNLRFNFFYRNKTVDTVDVVVPQKIFNYDVILPNQIVEGKLYPIDQCTVFICRIASPFHLLQANMVFNFMRTIPLRAMFPKWVIDTFAPFHSPMFYRSLKRLNRKGRNCRIHPSAILENAVLGDNVTVGARVVVRHSYIGSGTTLDDNVSIMNCVLGKSNFISNGNHISLSLTYNDVFLIHGPYQFSVFGKSVAAFAVINCDIRLDQKKIQIPTDVGILSSNQPLLGIAYGHHSKVGGGNIIAAGRIVPNHRVIDPPSNIILKFEP